MKSVSYRVLLAIFFLFSTVSTFAAEWVLHSSDKSGWDVTIENTYSASSDCNAARKEYIKDNPDRIFWCSRSLSY